MYKRDRIEKSEVNKKEWVRKRNVILNFRVTREEKEKIEARMALSGLTKQDYLIQSLTNQQVLCIGNIKSFEEMNKQLIEIGERLKTIGACSEIRETDLESIRMILQLYAGLNLLNNTKE